MSLKKKPQTMKIERFGDCMDGSLPKRWAETTEGEIHALSDDQMHKLWLFWLSHPLAFREKDSPKNTILAFRIPQDYSL